MEDNLNNQLLISDGLCENPSYSFRRHWLFRSNSEKGFVKKEQLRGTLLKALFANVKVSMLYFGKTVEALCLKDLLYELIIKNISEARAIDNPDETW